MTDTSASGTPAVDPGTGKSLYTYSGSGPVDTSFWTPSSLVGAAGETLYTFANDTSGGAPTGASPEWQVYTGTPQTAPSTPADPGTTPAPAPADPGTTPAAPTDPPAAPTADPGTGTAPDPAPAPAPTQTPQQANQATLDADVAALQGVVGNLQAAGQTLQSSASSLQTELANLQQAASSGQPLDFTQVNTVINDLVNAAGQIVSVTTTISTEAGGPAPS
jgi:hypothetical protein